MWILALMLAAQAPIVSSARAPKNVARVVSISPTLTEIVCAIGACDRLKGVTRFCDYPERVRQLPKIGGYVDPSLEATLALHPDLVVLTTNGVNKSFTEALDRARVAWIAFHDDALEDFSVIARTLGEALGADANGTIARFERELARVSEGKKIDASAFVVYGHAPLIVAGKGTFGAELLARIGAQNAYRGAQKYPTLDFEALFFAKPRWIIDVDMRNDGASEPEYYAPVRARMEASGARFVFSPVPALLRLGPRLPSAMLALRQRLE